MARRIRGYGQGFLQCLCGECLLANYHALARTPPGTHAGGMMITGNVVARTLVDHCFPVVVGHGSGWINAGAACVIFVRAPGVLFWVCLR
jgi:hypothetical protein